MTRCDAAKRQSLNVELGAEGNQQTWPLGGVGVGLGCGEVFVRFRAVLGKRNETGCILWSDGKWKCTLLLRRYGAVW